MLPVIPLDHSLEWSFIFMEGERVMEQRVLITVVGIDRIGIIAAVTNTLADHQVNILDIRQTIVGEFFTMILVADLKKSTQTIQELQGKLDAVGQQLAVKITVQSEELFRSMHRI
jgi:ACT domain-containing protein